MSDKRIKLNYHELVLASGVAVARRAANCINERRATHGAPNGPWERDLFGCQAELAVAKYLNLFWSGTVGDFGAPDVGGVVEVRTVQDPARRLILHPDDRDDAPFVSVVADAPHFLLRGWIMGKAGKRMEWWSDPTNNGRAAFFVPTAALHPMPNLQLLVPQLRASQAREAVPA